MGYLLGVPITGYSVAMTREHVEFAEAKLQARIFQKDLTEAEVSNLAAVAVAGEFQTAFVHGCGVAAAGARGGQPWWWQVRGYGELQCLPERGVAVGGCNVPLAALLLRTMLSCQLTTLLYISAPTQASPLRP